MIRYSTTRSKSIRRFCFERYCPKALRPSNADEFSEMKSGQRETCPLAGTPLCTIANVPAAPWLRIMFADLAGRYALPAAHCIGTFAVEIRFTDK